VIGACDVPTDAVCNSGNTFAARIRNNSFNTLPAISANDYLRP
jgi:hypothetical protein